MCNLSSLARNLDDFSQFMAKLCPRLVLFTNAKLLVRPFLAEHRITAVFTTFNDSSYELQQHHENSVKCKSRLSLSDLNT